MYILNDIKLVIVFVAVAVAVFVADTQNAI